MNQEPAAGGRLPSVPGRPPAGNASRCVAGRPPASRIRVAFACQPPRAGVPPVPIQGRPSSGFKPPSEPASVPGQPPPEYMQRSVPGRPLAHREPGPLLTNGADDQHGTAHASVLHMPEQASSAQASNIRWTAPAPPWLQRGGKGTRGGRGGARGASHIIYIYVNVSDTHYRIAGADALGMRRCPTSAEQSAHNLRRTLHRIPMSKFGCLSGACQAPVRRLSGACQAQV